MKADLPEYLNVSGTLMQLGQPQGMLSAQRLLSANQGPFIHSSPHSAFLSLSEKGIVRVKTHFHRSSNPRRPPAAATSPPVTSVCAAPAALLELAAADAALARLEAAFMFAVLVPLLTCPEVAVDFPSVVVIAAAVGVMVESATVCP